LGKEGTEALVHALNSKANYTVLNVSRMFRFLIAFFVPMFLFLGSNIPDALLPRIFSLNINMVDASCMFISPFSGHFFLTIRSIGDEAQRSARCEKELSRVFLHSDRQ
jgi:hypothetical protein